jgi:hypothetical protein
VYPVCFIRLYAGNPSNQLAICVRLRLGSHIQRVVSDDAVCIAGSSEVNAIVFGAVYRIPAESNRTRPDLVILVEFFDDFDHLDVLYFGDAVEPVPRIAIFPFWVFKMRANTPMDTVDIGF